MNHIVNTAQVTYMNMKSVDYLKKKKKKKKKKKNSGGFNQGLEQRRFILWCDSKNIQNICYLK